MSNGNNYSDNDCLGRTNSTNILKIWWGSTKSRNTIDEKWFKLVKSLPDNKAAGPSKITNEMIKYAGQNINRAEWRLVCA
nr:1429_t:CDS:2 [Entrophospora candida]